MICDTVLTSDISDEVEALEADLLEQRVQIALLSGFNYSYIFIKVFLSEITSILFNLLVSVLYDIK